MMSLTAPGVPFSNLKNHKCGVTGGFYVCFKVS